jgi:hypothetical protein
VKSLDKVNATTHPLPSGAIMLGAPSLNNRILIDEVIQRGIAIFEFIGSEHSSAAVPGIQADKHRK